MEKNAKVYFCDYTTSQKNAFNVTLQKFLLLQYVDATDLKTRPVQIYWWQASISKNARRADNSYCWVLLCQSSVKIYTRVQHIKD